MTFKVTVRIKRADVHMLRAGNGRNSIKLASWCGVLSSTVFFFFNQASPKPQETPVSGVWKPSSFLEALPCCLPADDIPCLTHPQLLHVLGNPGKDQAIRASPGH